MSKQIYIAWTAYQRRADTMSAALKLDLYHFPPKSKSKFFKAFGYISQFIQTAKVIFRKRPNILWVQSPPSFLIHFLLLLRLFIYPRYRIIADCHNAALRAPWTTIPGAIWALNRCACVLVHNSEIYNSAVALGIEPSRLMVLEDLPAEMPQQIVSEQSNNQPSTPYVIVPCSFHEDEPIDILLEAAKQVPEVIFKITGSRYKADKKGYLTRAPQNVDFTGFLSLDAYNTLFCGASIVLGLTTKEGIQLSVANEAIGASKALLLSDTKILRSLFGEAALFSLNQPTPLAQAIRETLSNRTLLEGLSTNLKVQRQQDWQHKMHKLLQNLEIADHDQNSIELADIHQAKNKVKAS